jgi:hypothetical protein
VKRPIGQRPNTANWRDEVEPEIATFQGRDLFVVVMIVDD